MIKKRALPIILFLFLLAGIGQAGYAQRIAVFRVTLNHSGVGIPLNVDLDKITYAPDSTLSLVAVAGNRRSPVPFQVEHGYHRILWWIADGKEQSSGKQLTFELLKSPASRKDENYPVRLQDENGALIISDKGKNVLQYNYKTVYPPKGVDTVFKRSGFIHPLWSPEGNVLTRINPPDHHHHVGIWNPWTDVLFEGRMVDFWNIGDKKGTVRFARFIAKNEGPVYSGFKALQEHVVLNDPTVKEKVALNEVWDIRVYNISENMWLWDFTSILNCATPDPVLLKEYRYGGFGFRATEQWDNQNSQVLTSSGKTRKDADATRARWCMIDGAINNGHSGILFMDYPANYNFPEPMRIWPENMNGRGDVFFSFSPTRNTDWDLKPDKNYVLKYRMLVYDGTITKEKAEQVWQNFAHPPGIQISK